MLVPTWLYLAAFYGAIATSLVAVVWIVARRDARRANRGTLPPASVAAPPWRRGLRWAPFALVLGGAFGACRLNQGRRDALVVRDVDGKPAVTAMTLLGTPDDPLVPVAGGEGYSVQDTWVLNRSSHAVRVETLSYARYSLGFGPSAPIEIPPGRAYTTYKIEYVGPGDHPPDQVQVEGLEANVGMSSRSWLTWDP